MSSNVVTTNHTRAAANNAIFGDVEAQQCYERALARICAFGGTLERVDLSACFEAAALLYEGPFVAERTAAVGDFQFVDNPAGEVAQLRLRCAILSHILFWKTTCLRIAFGVCIASVVLATPMIIYYEH